MLEWCGVELFESLQPVIMEWAPSTADGCATSERYFLRFLVAMYGAHYDAAVATQHVLLQLVALQGEMLAPTLARPYTVTGVRTTYRCVKQDFNGVAHCLRMHRHRPPLSPRCRCFTTCSQGRPALQQRAACPQGAYRPRYAAALPARPAWAAGVSDIMRTGDWASS